MKTFKKSREWLFPILPVMIFLLTIVVFPLIYSFNLSLHLFNFIKPEWGHPFVGLENYAYLLGDLRFLNSVRVSLIFTFSSIGLEFLIGLGLALIANREMKGIIIFRVFFLIPMMITPVVVGIMFRFLYHPELSVFNYILAKLGGPNPKWVASPETALPSLILTDIWQWTPFIFLVLLAGLQSLPREPQEAAMVDGASWWAIFRYITLPMLKPTILVILLIRIMEAMKDFDKIFILTGGGPGVTTETFSVFVYKTCFMFNRLDRACAASFIFLAIVTVIGLLFIRLLSKEYRIQGR